MGISPFVPMATLWGGVGSGMAAAEDTLLTLVGGHRILYTITRPGGAGLVAWDLDAAGGPVEIGRRALPGPALAGLEPRLTLAGAAAQPVLLLTGAGGGSGVLGVTLDGAGRPAGLFQPGAAAALPGDLTDLIASDDGAWLFGIRDDAQLPTVWSLGSGGAVGLVAAGAQGGGAGGGLVGLGTVRAGAATIVLGLTDGADTLRSYHLRGDGSLLPRDSLARLDGPGIANPSAIETVVLQGLAYAVVAASGSSSLTVLRVGEAGQLTVTDHLTDTLHTRFAGVEDIRLVTLDGAVWVLAAGSDDGISLFRLLPGGQLLHVSALADSAETALRGIGGIEMTGRDGGLDIVVVSGEECGISRFRVEAVPGAVLEGGAGDDVLTGGTGADILRDGAGSDRLTGGSGADIFVLGADGAADQITDFEVGRDRLDLGAWPFLRGPGQLQLTATSNGGVIRFGDEVLHIFTSTGKPLTAAQLQADFDAGSWGATRFLPVWLEALEIDMSPPPPPPVVVVAVPVGQNLHGSSGADVLNGTSRADRLFGGAGADRMAGGNDADMLDGGNGNDTLSGQGGFDTIYGGAGDDWLNGNAGNDTVYGGSGSDTIDGGIGWDEIYGDSGNDEIRGMDGYDMLYGGEGDDRIWGNNGNDRIWGGAGRDTLRGGLGRDILDGGAGADEIYGDSGPDDLFGGEGDDSLWGNSGTDVVIGGAGNDRLRGGQHADELYGGAGNDWLWGEAGQDRLDGGAGDDMLSGGSGADVFVFSGGADRIVDFGDDTDTLLLNRALWGGAALTPAQILDRYASPEGTGTVLDFGSAGTLVLDGLAPQALLNDLGLL